MRLSLTLSFLLLAQSVWCQSDHSISGTVKTVDGSVIPGLSFSVEKDGKVFERNGYRVGAFSDINGHFVFSLPAGNYKITASNVPEDRFRLFLAIAPHMSDAQHIDLTIDMTDLCNPPKTGSPTLTKSKVPGFPAAARAVRATGWVSILVTIRPDGSVSAAKAVSGHPLLRRASEKTAEEFTFEASNEGGERTSMVSFIFLDSANEMNDLKRYECPYRIVVPNPAVVIQTTDN